VSIISRVGSVAQRAYGLGLQLKATFSPTKIESRAPVVTDKPLYEQFQRIGGGLTPADVSMILQEADAGQPARLIDLGNETRQKDGHIQSICGTRDRAVALCDVTFLDAPVNAKRKDRKAIELCQRVVDEFENWPLMVEHLTASYWTGHATCELLWKRTDDGLLLPYKAKPLPPRDFIFAITDGSLRYARVQGDIIGVDLLADNPGRIIQVQRRIVGDAQVREGLIRLMVWMGLFRNWTLRDWIALGEIGWKPWRIGKYKKNATSKDIEGLVAALERIAAQGCGAIPETTELQVEWPKGMAPGTGGSGTHSQLFSTLGHEASKAVLGQTTSVEAGPNGDRGGVKARDEIRLDVRESDAISIASALRAHLFAPVIALNMPQKTRVPVPWFQTDEAINQVEFATAVEKLKNAGTRIPAKWVRDEIGMPAPEEGEEVLETTGETVDPEDEGGDPEPEAKPEDKAA
jgi:phage gp29-like protein